MLSEESSENMNAKQALQKKGSSLSASQIKIKSGLHCGICDIFVILFLLSNMIWEIDIKGAKPETEHQMVKHLEEIGVKKAVCNF